MKGIKHIGLGNMPVKRNRVKLRQHRDAENVGVDAVANGNIDQAVLACDRHCWFGTFGSEGVEALALSSAENDAEYLAGLGHNGYPFFRINIRQELTPAYENGCSQMVMILAD
jgi:hypothetical protein